MSPLPIDFFLVAYGRQCYICSDFQKIHYPLLNFYKCYQSKYSSRLLWQQNENLPSCSPFFFVFNPGTQGRRMLGFQQQHSNALHASVGPGYKATPRSSFGQFEECLSFPKGVHHVFPKARETRGQCYVPNTFESLTLLVGIPCCEEQAWHVAVAKGQLWHCCRFLC